MKIRSLSVSYANRCYYVTSLSYQNADRELFIGLSSYLK